MSDIEIKEICKKYKIENYTIKDGLVNVDGDVDFDSYKITEIPLKFGEVSGYFTCLDNQLTSLEGCPTYVGSMFDCSDNKLTSLGWSPRYVGGDFDCEGNELTDLKGCPDEVDGNFYCSDNYIYSLKGSFYKRINIKWIYNNPIYHLYCKYNLGDIYHRDFLIEADVIRPPDNEGGLPIINKDRMDWFTQTYGLEEFKGDENYKIENN